MIRIRQCGRPYEELELEGSRAELTALQQAILGFCESSELAVSVVIARKADFTPPAQAIERVRICRSETLLLVSIAGDQLLISGRAELLRAFAQNLPGIDSSSAGPERIRLDRLGLPNRICEASLTVFVSAEPIEA